MIPPPTYAVVSFVKYIAITQDPMKSGTLRIALGYNQGQRLPPAHQMPLIIQTLAA